MMILIVAIKVFAKMVPACVIMDGSYQMTVQVIFVTAYV